MTRVTRYELSGIFISVDKRKVPPAERSITTTTTSAYFTAHFAREVELLKTTFLFIVKLTTEEHTLAKAVERVMPKWKVECKSVKRSISTAKAITEEAIYFSISDIILSESRTGLK